MFPPENAYLIVNLSEGWLQSMLGGLRIPAPRDAGKCTFPETRSNANPQRVYRLIRWVSLVVFGTLRGERMQELPSPAGIRGGTD